MSIKARLDCLHDDGTQNGVLNAKDKPNRRAPYLITAIPFNHHRAEFISYSRAYNVDNK